MQVHSSGRKGRERFGGIVLYQQCCDLIGLPQPAQYPDWLIMLFCERCPVLLMAHLTKKWRMSLNLRRCVSALKEIRSMFIAHAKSAMESL